MDALRASHPRPPDPSLVSGRAVLEGRTTWIEDTDADPRCDRALARRGGWRRNLAVPVLREGVPIGAVSVAWAAPGPIDPGHVELLETFGEQAVIAIANARLLDETREALEQQTATAEILRVISRSPTDIRPVLDAVADSAARLCDANDVVILMREGEVLRSVKNTGLFGERFGTEFAIPVNRGSAAGRAVVERRTVHVPDFDAVSDDDYPEGRAHRRMYGNHGALVTPLVRGEEVLGVIAVLRREVRPFAAKQIALLQTFADQAVIAIDNARLFRELDSRNRELIGALEQQTATAEVLQIISRSTFDLQPVLETLIENAVRLCGADSGVVYRFDGSLQRLAASYNMAPAFRAFVDRHPILPGQGTAAGRAALEGRTVHIPDVAADPSYDYAAAYTFGNIRSILGVPMLRESEPVGVMTIWRSEVRPFTGKQIDLLTTFADQAAIAIENVRLFSELEARNREISEALEQQTATAEILRTISRSPTDLAPVFDAIAQSVSRLCDAPDVVIVRVEGDRMRFAASVGNFGGTFGPEFTLPIDRRSVAGRAVVERRTIQVEDLAAEPESEYPVEREMQRRYGHRTMVAAPLLLGEAALGVIAMLRTDVRPYTATQLALLQTFADQAVIAIENVRLFNEIEEKSRQLEIADRHKSAFLANMSHELRTPLNAVIGFSEMLAAKYFGGLTEKQAEYVNDIHASGRHLLSLINDILDLSKIEAGRAELDLSQFPLGPALENAVTLVRERAERGGAKLALDVDQAVGAVQGDERKVKQVVLNLLANAVRFTPRGGNVRVTARRHGDGIEIAVRDTGVGIAPEDQDVIFDAFRQVGTDVHRKREGTGLGLALARRFVELHGGSISVESAPGRGSTFTVTLPAGRHGE